MAYWTLQNLGVGNVALNNLARARLGVSRYQEIAILDQVRAEIAEAYAKTHARFAQIATSERAVKSGTRGLRKTCSGSRTRSLRRLRRSTASACSAAHRYAYLDSIIDYDRAQFELYVALGQPPADALAHPAPTEGVSAPGEPSTLAPLPRRESKPIKPKAESKESDRP